MGRRAVVVVGILVLAWVAGRSPLTAQSVPEAADLRSAFEAQFPKSDASTSALELERICAGFGLDLAPAYTNDRAHPKREDAAALQPYWSAVADFVVRELSRGQEKIGDAPPSLRAWMAEQGPALDSIESILVGGNPPAWEVDVSAGADAPIPNLAAHLRLHRLLVARALLASRTGHVDDALRSLEASWGLRQAVSSRPELISQLVSVAVARLEAGALRKIDSPAYEWVDRLRSRAPIEGILAALENDVWILSPSLTDLTGSAGALGRMRRRFAEDILSADPCDWTPATVDAAWERAFEAESRRGGETEALAEAVLPNATRMVLRVRRLLVDSELTALVLDARAERAASRRKSWPPKLRTVGISLCRGERWSYRVLPDGTIAVRYSGTHDEPDPPAPVLPFFITAGTPVPPKPKAPPARTAARGPAPTPVPTPDPPS